MEGLINKISRFAKKNAPTILTCLGVVGVVSTAALTAKETPKAMKDFEDSKDDGKITPKAVAVAAKDYIPAIAMGSATVACIVGSNVLNKKQQAALISAYGMLNEYFKGYRHEVVERYGEEVDEEICNAIMQRSICDWHYTDINYPDMKVWFHEPITDQYTLCYERNMMDAEYHTERNLMLSGGLPFNEFLTFAGFKPVENIITMDSTGNRVVDADLFGWSMYNGDYYWIDFEHRTTDKKIDGIPVFEIGYGWAWPDAQPEEEMGR